MDDLEQQIRRYADQVERTVPAARSRATPGVTPLRTRVLIGAAAAVVVSAVGVWFLVDRSSDLEIEPQDPIATPTSAPSPTSTIPADADPTSTFEPWTPPGESLDAGPLSPRHSAAVVASAGEVLVWGGSVESANVGRPDLASDQFVDGAVYDRGLAQWRMMAASPLPASQHAPVGTHYVERVLLAQGDATSFYDPATDSWTPASTAPFPVDELVVDGSMAPLAFGEGGAATFDLASGEWRLLGDRLDPATQVHHAWSGSTLYRVRQGESFVIEAWVEGATAWQPLYSVGARTGYFFDLAWVGEAADGRLVLVSEIQSAISFQPSTGTFETLPTLPGGGYEGGPHIDVVDDEILVRWAPNLYRFDGEDWTGSLLPAGLANARLWDSRGPAEYWWFGLHSSDVGGGNYFSRLGFADLALDGREPFDAGPLSPRHDALVLRLPADLLVWGGDVEPRNFGRLDLENEQFADGAVLELDSGRWRLMAPGPLPAIDRTPLGVALSDGRVLIVRGRSAAVYDVGADEWTELADAPFEIWEIEPMPEIDGVAASGRGGVAWFDESTFEWRDTGAEPAEALNRRLAWTGRELISVWGSITGAFRVEGWEPGGEWSDRGLVETGVSQVALDVASIEGEVWIVGYAMTVDVWDPESATSRSLPPLPVEFQEGTPEIATTADGRILVHRDPGIAAWTDGGWVVTPSAATGGFRDGDVGPGLDGGDVVWRFRLGREDGDGNRLQLVELPDGRGSTIQIGSFTLELDASDSLLGMGMEVAESGRVFDPWADIVTTDEGVDSQCRFSYSGGNVRAPDGSAAVEVHIVIGDWALMVRCDRALDVARFLPQVRHTWADAGLVPELLVDDDGE